MQTQANDINWRLEQLGIGVCQQRRNGPVGSDELPVAVDGQSWRRLVPG